MTDDGVFNGVYCPQCGEHLEFTEEEASAKGAGNLVMALWARHTAIGCALNQSKVVIGLGREWLRRTTSKLLGRTR